ncbi:MAG TPA: hypothetical protein VMX55_06040 [candidate division Zixibacteria bacterium]|nr:hypothetical protein [candidate division Zixibacteria bacterium]
MAQILHIKDNKIVSQIQEITQMESNLQNAIDDLILESELESALVSQHVSMIVTQLAMAAANLRIKKQQKVRQVI